MNRKQVRDLTHNASSKLTLQNPEYKQWVLRYTFLELDKDLGVRGDVTTQALFQNNEQVHARIIAKSEGVIAGVEELKYFLVTASTEFRPRVEGEFHLQFQVSDGDFIKIGTPILDISGSVRNVFAVERVVLNLLMRMSSVATYTRKIVDLIGKYDLLLTPTRKTLWGWLDKKAVTVGGGGTHRLNLSDGVIVKDTHLDLINRDFDIVFKRLASQDLSELRFLEIEINSAEELLFAAQSFKMNFTENLDSIPVFMFDNVKHEEVSNGIEIMKKHGLYDQFLFEASGNIDEKNILNYAQTGVDIISVGALTMATEKFDLSLKIS